MTPEDLYLSDKAEARANVTTMSVLADSTPEGMYVWTEILYAERARVDALSPVLAALERRAHEFEESAFLYGVKV
jgi:hypothetical protein